MSDFDIRNFIGAMSGDTRKGIFVTTSTFDEKAKVYGGCGPRLNEEKSASYWLNQPGSPKAKVNEKPQGETISYDELVKRWASD